MAHFNAANRERLSAEAREKYANLTDAGRAKIAQQSRKWQTDNPERARFLTNRSHASNPERTRNYQKKWAQEHKEMVRAYRAKPEVRARRKERRKKRKQNDPAYRLSRNMRQYARKMMKAIIAGNKPGFSSSKAVGCNLSELKTYMEAQFLNAMTWENYGSWEVDHIVPVAFWDLNDPRQRDVCFHYSNLQPMWAAENNSKHDTVPLTDPRVPGIFARADITL
jgi:hypothetical protein